MILKVDDIKKHYEDNEEPFCTYLTTAEGFKKDTDFAQEIISKITSCTQDVELPDWISFSWVSQTQISYGIHVTPIFID